MKHIIASSEGAWQSGGCGVYSEQQNRDCFVAVAPRNDSGIRVLLSVYDTSDEQLATSNESNAKLQIEELKQEKSQTST